MSVQVQFDKPRALKFDWPTLRTLENAMGGEPLGAIIDRLKQVSLTALTTVLRVGFSHEDPTLTEASVSDALVDYVEKGGRIAILGKAINDALMESGIMREPSGEDSALDAGIVHLDRVRHVKFGIKAMRLLEASMGGLGIAAIADQIESYGVNALTMALCVGLKTEDKDITPNLTVKMIERYIENGGSVRTLAKTVRDAIDATGMFKNEGQLLDESAEGNRLAATTSPS